MAQIREFGMMNETKARMGAGQTLALTRAEAINKFAELEAMLALLFAVLMKADLAKSMAAFSAVQNTGARLKIIARLLLLTYDDRFTAFFRGLTRKIDALNVRRNKIVHWI